MLTVESLGEWIGGVSFRDGFLSSEYICFRDDCLKEDRRLIQKYYDILGVSQKATLGEIKKAYRKKAMVLHPDVNDNPNANEQFILLNEAYEYLQNLKTGKTYDQKKHKYTRTSKQRQQRQWEQQERERARRRAQQHAKMKYEEFQKTDYYKNSVALDVMSDFLNAAFVLFLLVVVPIILSIKIGTEGFIFACVVIILSSPYWYGFMKYDLKELPFKELKPSVLRLGKTKTFQWVAACLANLVVLFKIGFNTLIEWYIYIWLLAGAVAVGLLISIWIKNKLSKRLMYLGIAPGFVSMFFLINFLFSGNPVTETYHFQTVMQKSKHGYRETTMIQLDGKKYDAYMGIRIFADMAQMKRTNQITYTIEDGLFGIRVVKDYEFHR